MDVDTRETTITLTEKPLGQQSSTPTSKLPLEQTRLYYDENADSYATTTQAVELGPTWKLLTERLDKGSLILDLGCGAGRDLKYFADQGYRVIGIDYSQKLVDIAQQYSHQPVRLMDFHALDFPDNTFDAV